MQRPFASQKLSLQQISKRFHSSTHINLGCLAAIAFLYFVNLAPPAQAQLFDGPVDRLPAVERNALRKGKVVVLGEKGNYITRILVKAKPSVVWDVLTDYANLSKFIPNMASSKVLEDHGDRKVIEQVDSRQVLLINFRSRTKIAVTEKSQQQIDFQLINGDLQSLKGSWKMELVSDIPRTPPTKVLITHTVSVQPKNSVPRETFYQIFKSSVGETLEAIAKEITRRSN